MNAHGREFALGARKLLILQTSIGGFVAASFFLLDGQLAAQSAIYGTFVSLVLSGLLRWGVQWALRADKGMAVLYVSAGIRFMLALVLFGVGLAALNLAPLPLIVGFCMSQVAYVLLMRKQPAVTNRI